MAEDSPILCTDLDVFLGTYDNYVFSYQVVQTSPDTFCFQRTNVQQPHSASVRSLATNGRLLASAGADDRIVVVDLRRAQEIQMLTHHTGTVNRVAFTPDGSHLFSASDDGQLAATKTGSWLTDNVWRTPHSGRAIQALALHPSGKLALTVGRDGTLRTWNLIKGRQCFTTNLRTLCREHGDTIETVIWSPAGGRFALIAVDRVLVMGVGSAAVEREWLAKGRQRTTALCWLDEERLLLGQESGRVRFVSIGDDGASDTPNEPIQLHENRVKDMALQGDYLVTMSCTSTAGELTLWRLNTDEVGLEQLCTTALGRRPICLAVTDARLYRPEPVPVSIEEEAAADEEEEEEPVVQRKIVSIGRVTIEKDDDEVPESLVSVLKTPKPKKTKTVVIDAAAEDADDTPERRTKKKKKRVVEDAGESVKAKSKIVDIAADENPSDETPERPRKKHNKRKSVAEEETSEPLKVMSKKIRRSIVAPNCDNSIVQEKEKVVASTKKSKNKSRDVPIADSPPVKSKKRNNSIIESNKFEKPNADRRKSSKW